jgi:chromosome segregation ATPase
MTRLLLVFAILAALAGCGGDDDGGSDGDGPARDEFVADVNTICREGEQKLDEVSQDGQEQLQQATSDDQQRKVVGDLLEQTAEEYRPYLDRLREVKAPEELAEDWTTFLDRISEAFDLIPELADATRENSEEKLSELTTKFSDIAEDTRPFAERTGLDDCLPDESTQ